jgi:hypothetical protein
MTNKLFHTVLVLSCLLLAFDSVKAQSLKVNGKVIEKDSLSVIPFAFVVNKSTGQGTVADADGKFSIVAQLQDTILFQSLGYVTRKTRLSDLLINQKAENCLVILYPATYQLKPFVVTTPGLTPNEKKFYRSFIDVPKPDISSPISLIYYNFSREGRSRQKLALLYEWEIYLENFTRRAIPFLRTKKVNMADFDIEHFARFCNFTNDFVLKANNYEFFFAISRSYDSYTGKISNR